jgi:hypothetical protein
MILEHMYIAFLRTEGTAASPDSKRDHLQSYLNLARTDGTPVCTHFGKQELADE